MLVYGQYDEEADRERNAQTVRVLHDEYLRGKLTLFLGAGMSKGCGLPLWTELTHRLFNRVFSDVFKENDRYFEDVAAPEICDMPVVQRLQAVKEAWLQQPGPLQSRFLKTRLQPHFLSTLREALYEDYWTVTEAIKQISRLKKLHAVCTYNYDDILESSADDSNFSPVACAGDTFETGKVPVYHVHGLLPQDSNELPRGDLVLSEEEYHKIYYDGYHWSNTVQVMLLRSSTCLLLGLSCEDPNLRRVLDVVAREQTYGRRYAVMRLPIQDEEKDTCCIKIAGIKEFIEQSLQELNVFPLWIVDYDNDIPAVIRAIGSSDPETVYREGTLKLFGS